MKQLRFPGIEFKVRKNYGGSINRGQRKIQRPFSSAKFLHSVFRAEGADMRKKNFEIEMNLYELAGSLSVCPESFANAGNHLHLLLRCENRKNFQEFLRKFSQKVARIMVGPNQKFWTDLVYTRIVDWGRDEKNVRSYILQNYLEANGLIPYQRGGPNGIVWM